MKHAFSLLELMIAMVVVGLLAAVCVPMYAGFRDKAIATEIVGILGVVETACQNYYVEHGAAVQQVSDLEDAGLIIVRDLGGKYFSAADVSGVLGGFSFEEHGLSAGSGAAKGITVTKSAAGVFSVSGAYVE